MKRGAAASAGNAVSPEGPKAPLVHGEGRSGRPMVDMPRGSVRSVQSHDRSLPGSSWEAPAAATTETTDEVRRSTSSSPQVPAPEKQRSKVGPGSIVKKKLLQARCSCVYHPHSRIIQQWNMLIAMLLLLQAPFLPLQLAFIHEKDIVNWPWLMWCMCWIEIVFWLDMFLQFLIQVPEDDQVHWSTDLLHIAWSYKFRFIIDFISVFPLKYMTQGLVLDLVNYYVADHSSSLAECLVALIGFLKLLRFARAPRALRSLQAQDGIVSRYMEFTNNQNALFKSIVTIIFSVHVMACLWAALACSSGADYNWYKYLKALKKSDMYQTDNVGIVYMCSLYWAVYTLTGIGYGDVVPISPTEYCVSTLCMLVGSLTWAWVVANIVSIMATLNRAANDHLQTLDCINELLREKNVRIQLGRRLREYFTRLRDVKEHDFVGALIDQLSPELRIDVVCTMHSEWIEKVWWLRRVPMRSDFIVDLTQSMRSSLHTPNEFIANKKELSIIRQGLCIHGGQLMTKGNVFGEDMLLNNEILRKPHATLALTFLYIHVLTKASFNRILSKHPDVQPMVRKAYVVFVVIRGMLHKAECIKRQRKEQSRARRMDISAIDPAVPYHAEHDELIQSGGGGEHESPRGLSARSLNGGATASAQIGRYRRMTTGNDSDEFVSDAEVDMLIRSMGDLCTQLKSRMTGLEKTTDRLSQQVRSLMSST